MKNLFEILNQPGGHVFAMEEATLRTHVAAAIRDIAPETALPAASRILRAYSDDPHAKSRALGVPDRDIEAREDIGIAVVRVAGIISVWADYFWDATDPRALAFTLQRLAAAGYRTIILYIDSPGGHAIGLVELATVMDRLRESGIEIIAYTDTLAASAAYWIAAGAGAIFASPSAMVGSVGVYSVLYTFEDLLAELGVKLHLFRDGTLKGLGVFGKELTPDESAHLAAEVQRISTEFKGYVRTRRGADRIQDATIQGQCHPGAACVASGLIDGTFATVTDLIGAVLKRQK